MFNEYNNMGIYNQGGYTPQIKKGINWNSILNNTQRTLGIINQAIPIVYQLKPLVSNAKTMLRIAGALNSKEDKPKQLQNSYNTYDSIEKDSNSLKFFL